MEPNRKVMARIRCERAVVREIARSATAAGYKIAIDNGEYDFACSMTKKLKTVMSAIMQTDSDNLYFYGPHSEANEGADGWVRCVYGNDGWDVISDYTVNLEPVIAGAIALALKYEERMS